MAAGKRRGHTRDSPDNLTVMLQDPDIATRLQEAQRLDAGLDSLSFSAPARLQQHILARLAENITPTLILSTQMRSKYAGYALMGMAACLPIGIFAQPLAQNFFDYAQAALSGETPDLFKVSFETWKI